ncbi:MAG: molybdenum cofactor biosynthesis protein MoaE [Pseudomonadota bacterium]
MTVELFDTPFEPYTLLQQHQSSRLKSGSYGACASFVGSMRDFNEGDRVRSMELEHYPGMTEKQLAEIVEDAKQQWPLDDALVAHRVGLIQPGEPIVLTVCWSTHRAAAFEACRFLMEALKSRAPFWKKETLGDDDIKGEKSRWVANNTAGYSEK